MKAIRKVAKSGQISLTPEIIDLMGIEAGDYIEYDVIRIVRKASESKMSESELQQNPMMPTPELIFA